MALATQRAALESLLRDRKLDTTLTSAHPLQQPAQREQLLPFGPPALEDALLGGLPRGQVSEIAGGISSGRTSLLVSLLARATARGELVALVDALDRFDPKSAAEAGVALDQVCWLRGDAAAETQTALDPGWEPSRPRAGQPRQTPLGRELSRAVKASGLALSSGVFTLVVLDVADVPVRLLRGLPFTTWMRLHRLIAGSDTACVLVTPQPIGRSAGGASIRLEQDVRPSTRSGRTEGRRDRVERGQNGRDERGTFHERVHASRRPFVGVGRHEAAAARAGVWYGTGPVPRRFRGLAVQAHVQAGLHATSCALELTNSAEREMRNAECVTA